MSKIKKLTPQDHESVKHYIYQNFWGCIEIAKIFDKNGCSNKMLEKNSGDFFGYFNESETLEGIFVFTNNKRFLVHFNNNDVTKKVDLLKAIKYYKPEFMSGPKAQVKLIWQMFERTVKRYTYRDSMYMVLEDFSKFERDFLPAENVREASTTDAKEQMRFFVEIEKEFERNHMTINQMQKRISDRKGSKEYLVMDDGLKLIAQGFVEDKIKAFSQIGGVYTSPKYRGNGFGKAIIQTLCYHILQDGQVPILAVLKDNLSAIKVYESLYFKRKVDFSIIELEF